MISSAAILVAAGKGERLAGQTAGIPKQFIDLGNVPIFIWSLTTFAQHPQIDKIILTVPEDWQKQAIDLISQYLPKHIDKIMVIAGGNTRQESVYCALEKLALASHPLYVIIHDSVRPFITTGSIDQIIDKLKDEAALTLGIALSDSIRKTNGNKITEDLERSQHILVQTPQAAQFELMLNAHRQAKLKQYLSTDDSAIVKFYGKSVTVIPGSRLNLKITEPDDLLIAQALIGKHNWCPGKINLTPDKKLISAS